MDQIEENDLVALKTIAIPFAISETALPGSIRRDNAVIVLIDEQSQKAYLLPTGKYGISVYHHGVKMVKELLS